MERKIRREESNRQQSVCVLNEVERRGVGGGQHGQSGDSDPRDPLETLKAVAKPNKLSSAVAKLTVGQVSGLPTASRRSGPPAARYSGVIELADNWRHT